jgi:hypothetical protein
LLTNFPASDFHEAQKTAENKVADLKVTAITAAEEAVVPKKARVAARADAGIKVNA